MRRIVTSGLMLVVLAASGGPSARAQEVESALIDEGTGLRSLSRLVVVENMEGLTDGLAQLIAGSVGKRLRKERPQADVPRLEFMSVGRQGGGGFAAYPEGLVVWSLQINYTPGKSPDAPELWEQARRELEAALRTVQKRAHEAQMLKFAKHSEDRATRFVQAQQRMERYTTELTNILAEDFGDFAFLRTELLNLATQARVLRLEQIGVGARRMAIEQRIDELRKRMATAAENDPLLEEMKKIVQARKQQVESAQMRRQAGADVVTADVHNAEAEFAAAQAQLIRGQREAGGQADGAVIQEFNNELSKLIIKAAEQAEQQKAVEREITELREKTDPRRAAEVEMLKARIAMAQEQLAEAERRRAELDREPPSELEQITIRPLEEALLGEEAEAPPAESP